LQLLLIMINIYLDYISLKFGLDSIKNWLRKSGLKRETLEVPSMKRDALLVAA
jgi:hypothetical protein